MFRFSPSLKSSSSKATFDLSLATYERRVEALLRHTKAPIPVNMLETFVKYPALSDARRFEDFLSGHKLFSTVTHSGQHCVELHKVGSDSDHDPDRDAGCGDDDTVAADLEAQASLDVSSDFTNVHWQSPGANLQRWVRGA